MLILTLSLFLSVPAPTGNILLVIADDIGTLPTTPTIQSLQANGVTFKTVYAYPTCSPTRACIMTGRYGFRTKIGTALAIYSLAANEQLIPELTQHKTAMIGKWHLSNIQQFPFTNPNDQGFDHFSGTQWNIPDYCEWQQIRNGQVVGSTQYATTVNVDDALSWIKTQTDHWFLTLAFNTAHSPYHIPGCPTEVSTSRDAMILNMDTKLGQLLGSINLTETTVIFIGDNGDPVEFGGKKGTIYEKGIRVPLVIAHNGVVNPGRTSTALVQALDLFATSLELMGNTVPQTDSKSLVPILKNQASRHRDWIVSEKFPNGVPENADYCIRGQKYKYLKFYASGAEEFYNLVLDPNESVNLINDPALAGQINALRTTVETLRVW